MRVRIILAAAMPPDRYPVPSLTSPDATAAIAVERTMLRMDWTSCVLGTLPSLN